jgi:hypothetical protein
MRQSEVLNMVHENTHPKVKKLTCNMFAPFTDEDNNPCIQAGVEEMMSAIEDISNRRHKRHVMMIFGMLVSTFNASIEADRDALERKMQAADEAEMERNKAL